MDFAKGSRAYCSLLVKRKQTGIDFAFLRLLAFVVNYRAMRGVNRITLWGVARIFVLRDDLHAVGICTPQIERLALIDALVIKSCKAR